MEELGVNGSPGPGESKFAGFDLRDRHYEARTFVCQGCPNVCEINRIVVGDQQPIFYGARCDMYDRRRTGNGHGLPDLYAERQELLMGDYVPPPEARSGRLRVGLPRTLFFYDLFPYWRTFFRSLDIEVVLSRATTPRITSLTKEHAVVEACHPVRLAYGHVIDLLDGATLSPRRVDVLFLPSIVDRESGSTGQAENKYCPYIPAVPHLIRGWLDDCHPDARPLISLLRFYSKKTKLRDLAGMARQLGVSQQRVLEADADGIEAQRGFRASLAPARARDTGERYPGGHRSSGGGYCRTVLQYLRSGSEPGSALQAAQDGCLGCPDGDAPPRDGGPMRSPPQHVLAQWAGHSRRRDADPPAPQAAGHLYQQL
jgi:hypothetical protein